MLKINKKNKNVFSTFFSVENRTHENIMNEFIFYYYKYNDMTNKKRKNNLIFSFI